MSAQKLPTLTIQFSEAKDEKSPSLTARISNPPTDLETMMGLLHTIHAASKAVFPDQELENTR